MAFAGSDVRGDQAAAGVDGGKELDASRRILCP